jgi:hypothetical protein
LFLSKYFIAILVITQVNSLVVGEAFSGASERKHGIETLPRLGRVWPTGPHVAVAHL